MTAVVVDASTHTWVARNGVVGIMSDAAGVSMVGQPALCRRAAAFHKRRPTTRPTGGRPE